MKIFVLRGEARTPRKGKLFMNHIFKAFKNKEDGEKYVFDSWEGITKEQDDRHGECYILITDVEEDGTKWTVKYWFEEIELD